MKTIDSENFTKILILVLTKVFSFLLVDLNINIKKN